MNTDSLRIRILISNEEFYNIVGFALEKKWWLLPESNWGHVDFQSTALPTELKSLGTPESGKLVSIITIFLSQGCW
jgi:hypothetical protein